MAAEGYRRFDAFYLYTWQFGIHEYCSPTYYTTDLSGLLFVEERAHREQARQQAARLLKLLWTDIALNWFPGSQKFGGTQSRSYNYLYGLGGIDTQLWLQGWLTVSPEPTHLLTTAFAPWSPPAELRAERQPISATGAAVVGHEGHRDPHLHGLSRRGPERLGGQLSARDRTCR